MYVATGDDAYLNHALVPFRSAPVYLRLVNTTKRALDYAAAGFHVSVTRALAGGCRDPSNSFNGTTMAECTSPLGRDDLKTKWAFAAAAYREAYSRADSLSEIVGKLRVANQVADVAYAGEGVDPPRDPETGASEPVQAYRAGLPWWMIAGGIAIVAGTILSKKRRGRKGRARRRSRRRRWR